MIGAGRTALLNVLTSAGIRASSVVPERVTPPLSVIQPASDWVTSGETFGAYRLGFDVTVIVKTAANATVSSTLDDAIDAVLVAVSGAQGFYVGSVGAPSILSVQNAEFLSATLTVYQNTRL
jgi:hypothetical protein